MRNGFDVLLIEDEPVVRELVPLIQELANPIERAHYVQRLARLTQVDERTIQREIERQAAASAAAGNAERQARHGGPPRLIRTAPVTRWARAILAAANSAPCCRC